MRSSSVLGILYIHAIVVTHRIVLALFSTLFLCDDALFLSLFFCLHLCVCAALVLALRSWLDFEPPEEYQEPPSSAQFEQFEQQENTEEGKYNMNNLSLLNIISYCILILYAYKDFPRHLISFI